MMEDGDKDRQAGLEILYDTILCELMTYELARLPDKLKICLLEFDSNTFDFQTDNDKCF